MSEIIITGVVGIITTIISWFLAKRKYNSEVDSTVIHNLQSALELYKNLSDDTKKRLAESCDDNEKMRQDNARIKEENAALKVEISELKEDNKSLRKEIDSLKDQLLKVTATICLDLSCQIRNKNLIVQNPVKEEVKTKKTNKTK